MPLSRDQWKSAFCILIFLIGMTSWVSAAAYAMSTLRETWNIRENIEASERRHALQHTDEVRRGSRALGEGQ